MPQLPNEKNKLNNLIVTFQKDEDLFKGAIIKYSIYNKSFDECICPNLNANNIDFPTYLRRNHPYKLLEKVRFLKLSFIDNHSSRIEEIHEHTNFLDETIKRNTFKKVTKHLIKSGITQTFIDNIPENYAYYGMREVCFCGIKDCYHSNMLIIKYSDHFVIPYFYSFASPNEFLDFDIRNLKPTPEYDLNRKDEDDWEKIFDEDLNYLGKKKPEFKSSHMVKREDFKISESNLFKI